MDITSLSGPSFRNELKIALKSSAHRRQTKLKALTLRLLPKSTPKKTKGSEPVSGFLALPPEIREKIYRYVFEDTLIWDGKRSHTSTTLSNTLSNPHPRIDPSWKWIRRRLLPAYVLLLVLLRFSSPIKTTTFILHFLNHLPAGGVSVLRLNRQTSIEASHILYSSFTFCFSLRAFGNLPGDTFSAEDRQPRTVRLANAFTSQIGKSACQSLSYLELTLLMPDILSTTDEAADALCKSRGHNHWLALCQVFNETFPNLKSVSLLIHPSLTDQASNDGPGEAVDRILEVARCFGKKSKIIEVGGEHQERYGYRPDSWETKFVKDCKTKWDKELRAAERRERRGIKTASCSHEVPESLGTSKGAIDVEADAVTGIDDSRK